MKYLVVCALLLFPAALYAQYSTEAMQIKKLSDQYDQRGYMSGQAISVDGNLVLSNSNGVPSYVYPISSYTSNGFPINVTLNYCGSASFTTFHRYYNSGVNDNWSKYSKSAPLWILNVNGFAVQTLSFASTFYDDPYYMKKNNPVINPPLTKYTDNHLVWTVEGYDFCSSMQFMQTPSENMQDAIRILRGDGGILELRNTISYDDIPNGSGKNYANTALYTGDYYPHDLNNSGYARVLFDSAYIKTGATIAEPYRIPRVLKYYPGDGLEYVFREFVLPFGKEPPLVQWTNGGQGIPAFGGYAAAPKIFYLEEINDGSYTVIKFERKRQLYSEQRNLHPDSSSVVCTPTRGRALCTGFTGHTLIYGSNSFIIEALGRTTTVKFSTAQFGSSYKENLAGSSDMFEWAYTGADVASTSDQGSNPSLGHNSYVGFVTSITDPQKRVTQFEYEKYKRTFEGIGFPHDLNYSEELPVELAHWRLSKVIEPTAEQTLEYHGLTNMTLQAGGGELTSSDPAIRMQIKYALNPMVKALKKYDNDGVLLSSQKFTMNLSPVHVTPDLSNLQEEWVSTDTLVDEVTHQRKWTDYHFHRFEMFSFKRAYQGNQSLPFTQQFSTNEVAGDQVSYTQTHYARLGKVLCQPVSSFTRVSHNGGVFVNKKVEVYEYDTTTVRSYPTNPVLKDTLGREISERRTIVKNPANTNQILWKEKSTFIHIPIKDTVFLIRERQWNKFAALAEYFRQDSIARLTGTSIRWEDVMGCIATYDTIETTGKHTLPPLYNLNTRTIITDANNNILRGSARLYSTTFWQGDSTAVYRGALLADSIIGLGGVRTLGNRYTYWGGFYGFYKTLLRTKENVNGSVAEFLYDYGCPNSLNSGIIRKNDNSTENISLLGRTGANEYESPLGQVQTIRSFDSGTLQTNTLRQMYERTYFDQISASIDPNGWYSRFTYDKNGRLKSASLPYDFQGDSLYSTEWNGKVTVEMPGYTIYRRTFDTLYCNGTYKLGGAVNTLDYSRMVAARPVTVVTGCGSGIAAPPSSSDMSGKKEQVLLANLKIVETNKWYRGYCSGSTSQEIADAVKLEKATLVMHVSKVFGNCVNFRVSVLEPKNILNRWGDNKFDTLLAKTFVLNCSSVMTSLSTAVASGLQSGGQRGKRGRETVLDDDSGSMPYQELRMDLRDILDDLIKKDWIVEVDVLTSGAEVELVSDAKDYQPRLELQGDFKRVYGLADYTVQYTHYDSGKKPFARTLISTKLDDSLHTASSIGLGSSPLDNKRYTEKQAWFGGDYRVAKSYEIIGDPSLPSSPKDSIVFGYTGFGRQAKVRDQLGDTISTRYDLFGRPTVVFNDDGSFTMYRYETGVASVLVGDSDQDFYGFAQKTTIRNEIGVKRHQFYDAFNRLRREVTDTANLNLITKYEYDILGRLTTVVNPKGDTVRYWYDDYSRIKYKYQPDIGYISYSYDKLGNLRFTQTQQQASTGQLTFTQYDDLNRVVLIGETDLDNGNVGGGGENPPPHGIFVGNGGGGSKGEKVMSFPPHPIVSLNRLTDVLDGSYLHDDGISGILTANKTVRQAPQASIPMFWSFSTLGETNCIPQPIIDPPVPPYVSHPVQNYTDPGLPLALSTSFENISRYPQNARMAIQYDVLPSPGGSVWTYFPVQSAWDALTPSGRVRNLKGKEAAVAYRQHAGEPYHFTVMSYDERGRMEAVIHYTENLGFDAVYYTYNSMNMVTSIRVVDPHRQYTTWYGYNGNGQMDSVWTKLSSVGMGLGVSNPVYRAPENRGNDADIVYSYTKRWQVDNMKYPLLNTQVQYSYSGRLWLDSMVATRSGAPLFRQVMHYTTDGLIERQKWEHGTLGEKELQYTYDEAQRLRWAYNPPFTEVSEYRYDAAGNWLYHSDITSQQDSWADSHTYTGAGGANRLARIVRTYWNNNIPDTTNYGYNANGALTSRTSRNGNSTVTETMNYDNLQGLLKQYIRTEGTTIVADWRYRANAAGEREQKRLYSSTQTPAKEWTYYLLSPGKQQLAVYKGIETKMTSCEQTVGNYVYLCPSEYLTFGVGRVHNLTVRPMIGGMSKKEYKVQDYLGSTRVVLDQYGGIIGNYDYDAFGECKWSSSPEQRLSYIDKEKDKESNLGDFGVRKYDSRSGRFFSIDPLWEKYRNQTPYHYVGNNPLQWIDPTGFGKEDVDRMSREVGDKLDEIEKRSSDGNEHGFAIYRNSDGTVTTGGIVTDNDPVSVEIPKTPGEGQEVAGTAHSHPPLIGDPPSPEDIVKGALGEKGAITFIAAGEARFAIEVADPDAALKWAQQNYMKTDEIGAAVTSYGIEAIKKNPNDSDSQVFTTAVAKYLSTQTTGLIFYQEQGRHNYVEVNHEE